MKDNKFKELKKANTADLICFQVYLRQHKPPEYKTTLKFIKKELKNRKGKLFAKKEVCYEV